MNTQEEAVLIQEEQEHEKQEGVCNKKKCKKEKKYMKEKKYCKCERNKRRQFSSSYSSASEGIIDETSEKISNDENKTFTVDAKEYKLFCKWRKRMEKTGEFKHCHMRNPCKKACKHVFENPFETKFCHERMMPLQPPFCPWRMPTSLPKHRCPFKNYWMQRYEPQFW